MNASQILDFWFGPLKDERHQPNDTQMKTWFQGGQAIDDEIRERFAGAITKAVAGDFDAWTETPESHAALIVLLDQFPRNIFRGTPQAFAADPIALKYCKLAIERGHDRKVHPVISTFVYLPLEHSEDLDDQELCIELLTKLAADVHDDAKKAYDGFLAYAVQHRDIIKEFGRFPHRNAILGRESTDEEREFLMREDVHFGQKSGK